LKLKPTDNKSGVLLSQKSHNNLYFLGYLCINIFASAMRVAWGWQEVTG
jgi:hypothetical protein